MKEARPTVPLNRTRVAVLVVMGGLLSAPFVWHYSYMSAYNCDTPCMVVVVKNASGGELEQVAVHARIVRRHIGEIPRHDTAIVSLREAGESGLSLSFRLPAGGERGVLLDTYITNQTTGVILLEVGPSGQVAALGKHEMAGTFGCGGTRPAVLMSSLRPLSVVE